ncbi:ribbon-helix-helix domain-containing protein [Sphingomonas abaci]|uniref:Putative DNA-binding ribbon-helix-helix protein n=1 Tax=Sphingomonas abaci TaxID=237611 RepID=A0A7W7AL22_9SPHN|nr:ribbon-helix-helix domain-containing protein [Sphingomonas abaci]MBB4619015.1 putative DNA-binding ribbon-helix-helix protein [Sphingomonas abaci]
MPAPTLAPPPGGFVGPVKRSITIAGHQTSISLEPLFWSLLERCAADRALPLSALVAEVDAVRILAEDAPNLASALRSWLLAQCLAREHENKSQLR